MCTTKWRLPQTISYIHVWSVYCTKRLLYSAESDASATLSSCCCFFSDATQLELVWNSPRLLFICLLTRSHKSAVLFLLSSCVVLVLYSYQESTLLWRPWIPLIKIKRGVLEKKKNMKVFISFSFLMRLWFDGMVCLFERYFFVWLMSKFIMT